MVKLSLSFLLISFIAFLYGIFSGMLDSNEIFKQDNPGHSQIVKPLEEQNTIDTTLYRAVIDTIAAELPIEKAKLLKTGLAKEAVSTSK